MLRMLEYMEKKCVAIPMKAAKAICPAYQAATRYTRASRVINHTSNAT